MCNLAKTFNLFNVEFKYSEKKCNRISHPTLLTVECSLRLTFSPDDKWQEILLVLLTWVPTLLSFSNSMTFLRLIPWPFQFSVTSGLAVNFQTIIFSKLSLYLGVFWLNTNAGLHQHEFRLRFLKLLVLVFLLLILTSAVTVTINNFTFPGPGKWWNSRISWLSRFSMACTNTELWLILNKSPSMILVAVTIKVSKTNLYHLIKSLKRNGNQFYKQMK